MPFAAFVVCTLVMVAFATLALSLAWARRTTHR